MADQPARAANTDSYAQLARGFSHHSDVEYAASLDPDPAITGSSCGHAAAGGRLVRVVRASLKKTT